jgi:hypothetical protein
MNEVIPSSSRWLRWAHEYAFSLNLTWIIVWLERVRNKTLGGPVLAHFVSRLVGRAYQLVSPIGGFTILEQLVWSFGVALIVFVLLRSLSGFAVMSDALRTVAGAVSIAAFPIATLFFGLTYPDCCADTSKIGLGLELTVVVVCAILFYRRKPLIPGSLMIVILVLHFILWGWATSSYVNVVASASALRSDAYYDSWERTLGVLGFEVAFKFGFPVFGLLASLIWVRFVRRPSESSGAAAAP